MIQVGQKLELGRDMLAMHRPEVAEAIREEEKKKISFGLGKSIVDNIGIEKEITHTDEIYTIAVAVCNIDQYRDFRKELLKFGERHGLSTQLQSLMEKYEI